MGRWDNYLDRVDEKVSKKEISEALKNDNILIGCEFEFKLDDELDISGDSEVTELYQSAEQEVSSYNDDVDTYESELEEYQDETQELKDEIDRKDDRIVTLEDAIETNEEEVATFETEIEELESELEDVENEITDLEAGIDDLDVEEGDILDDLKSQLKDLEKDRDDFADKIADKQKRLDGAEEIGKSWQEEVDQLERDKSNDEDDLKYREDEGMWEHVETPYASEQSMPDYFSYMTDYQGYSRDDLYTEPGERIDPPPEWEQERGYEDIETAVEGSDILSSAPFDNYRIGTYGTVDQRKGDRHWAIEDDSSIEGGLEIKNPPMELPTFMEDYLKDMFDWINQIGYTDEDCGFHVHMSMDKVKSELDVLKLILFTDEGWIFSAFEDRAYNNYTYSSKARLKQNGMINKKDADALFGRKKLLMKLSMNTSGRDGVNVKDLETGHVEFRYMGGNYSNKYRDVVKIIGMYAHNLSMAMDPEYKRKEYIQKLQRIFNKMELYAVEKKIDMAKNLLQGDEQMYHVDRKLLTVRLKEAEQLKKRLESVYKLDSRTKIDLNSNTGFSRQTMIDVATELTKGLSKTTINRVKRDFGSSFR